MPVTVLQEDVPSARHGAPKMCSKERRAPAGPTLLTREARPPAVDVTTRSQKALSAEAMALEAHRGYDLLMIGKDGARRAVDLPKKSRASPRLSKGLSPWRWRSEPTRRMPRAPI